MDILLWTVPEIYILLHLLLSQELSIQHRWSLKQIYQIIVYEQIPFVHFHFGRKLRIEADVNLKILDKFQDLPNNLIKTLGFSNGGRLLVADTLA